MKKNVLNMGFNRSKLFSIAWRIAILMLPWQTRWMSSATLGGWPWEQGTVAIYVSWFPVLATIILGWSFARRTMNKKSFLVLSVCSLIFILTSLAAIIFSDPDTRLIRSTAMLQWWIQCSMLFSFATVLWRAGITVSVLIDWFIISMLPHIGLGIMQYVFQTSPASTMFGVAQHVPSQLGVSVIEHDGIRILRAYGGFPHPNIFGGLLALTMILIVKKLSFVIETKKSVFYFVSLIGCSMALIFTYSRSAWIAVIIALFVCAVHLFRESRGSNIGMRAVYLAYACIGITCFSVALSQAKHIFTRFNPSARLETKSLSTRTQGLQDGIALFIKKPLFGSGVHAALLDISAHATRSVFSEPVEPPHLAYLLLLLECGIVGLFAFIVLCVYFLPRSIWRTPLLIIGIIAFFDHYLVSLWAGQSLVMLCVLLSFLPYIQKQEEYSTV